MRAWMSVFAALLIAISPSSSAQQFPPEQALVEATIEAQDDGTFLCTVLIRDAADQSVVAAPTIRFVSGESATVTMTPQDDTSGTLKVDVVADADAASARASPSPRWRTASSASCRS